MKREEVLQRLQPLTEKTVRHVKEAERSKVNFSPEIVTLRPGSGGALVPLNDNATKALTNFTGIPSKLRKDLSTDTFNRAINELLRKKERYTILLEGGEVIDFTEYQELRAAPPARLVDTIEKAVPRAEYHRVVIADNYSASIEVVGEKRHAVARGDIVRAGARVIFSPIGAVLPAVQSFAVRLICTNGLTSEVIDREYHGGNGGNGDDDGDIWTFFRNSIKAAYGSLDQLVERYRNMRQERIAPNQRAEMLEALLRQAHITGEDANAVRAYALERPPRNSWELMNVISWASSHVITDPRRLLKAQRTVSTYTSEQEHTRLCPVCHASRN